MCKSNKISKTGRRGDWLMKLLIILKTAAALITFDMPKPGSYYLYSMVPGEKQIKIETSNYVTNSVHVAYTIKFNKTEEKNRIYWVYYLYD